MLNSHHVVQFLQFWCNIDMIFLVYTRHYILKIMFILIKKIDLKFIDTYYSIPSFKLCLITGRLAQSVKDCCLLFFCKFFNYKRGAKSRLGFLLSCMSFSKIFYCWYEIAPTSQWLICQRSWVSFCRKTCNIIICLNLRCIPSFNLSNTN